MNKKIRLVGKIGITFIFCLTLIFGNSLADEATTATTTSSENEEIKISVDKANVYAAKDSTQVIAQKVKDEKLDVISKETSWLNIKLSDDVNGWIRLSDVSGAGAGIHEYKTTGTVVKKYSDDSISVTIEKISKYYVTKIWLKDPSSQVKKAEAGWGKSLKTTNSMLNSKEGAIVGINASGFYSAGAWSPSESAIKKTAWDKTTEGYLVITEGVIHRQISGQKCNALLGILPNGSLKYYENNPYTDVINDGVKNTFTFGPAIILDGKSYSQKVGTPRKSMTTSRYTNLIGQVDSNNFVIITAASKSTLKEERTMGLKLDCQLLYNFDGGGSTTLWFRNGTSGKGTQVKSSSRGVADALYFKSLK